MIKTRLKYCVFDPDPRGNPRYYVRLPGRPKIRIRETFEDENGCITAEFLTAYRAACEGAKAVKRNPPKEDTFDWLVDRYYRSAEFRDLDPATQVNKRRILGEFLLSAGPLPYKKYRHEDVIASHKKRRATPAAADNFLKSLSRLFNWAIENKLATYNPVVGVKKTHKSDGWHTWTDAEVSKFRSHFPIGTKPRLALELLLAVGARRSDAHRLGRQHESDGWLRFTAHKNRKKSPVVIEVPILPELRAALDQTKTGDLTYIVSERGQPYTVESFGNMFRQWCNEAGLPHCSAHGLRKAAAVALAENGATAPELCAIFGWTKLETAEIYIRRAQKKKMARNAFARLDDFRNRENVSRAVPSKLNETKKGKNRAKTTTN